MSIINPHTNDDTPLEAWCQGDFAREVGGFLFATKAEAANPYDAKEQIENINGLVAISQTCDIVRRTGERHYVTMCPLITVADKDIKPIKKGLRPYLTDITNANENEFADLRQIMSVDKDLVRTWDRTNGFPSEETRIRFAAALERKFGQFAFPNEFDVAIQEFRKRVWQRHDKAGSDVGKVYRSLEQIRFKAIPNWNAKQRKIQIIAILKPTSEREIERQKIANEITEEISKIKWPDGYEWEFEKLLLGSANDLTALDVLSSRRGDFDFLCF